LFEQLNQPPQDELAHNWKIIATSVNVLSQRMSQQRELRRRLSSIDEELDKLRNTILQDLQEIQRASDQQLSMARLRAEVSSLAQARLSSKLRNTPT
jgi:SOS response regulatory protein OraA/RecX